MVAVAAGGDSCGGYGGGGGGNGSGGGGGGGGAGAAAAAAVSATPAAAATGRESMNASGWEQDLAASKGVAIRHWLRPRRVIVADGRVTGLELDYTRLADGRLDGTGGTLTLAADQVFRAIGQSFVPDALDGDSPIALEAGRIRVDSEGRTSLPKVWAAGCLEAQTRIKAPHTELMVPKDLKKVLVMERADPRVAGRFVLDVRTVG